MSFAGLAILSLVSALPESATTPASLVPKAVRERAIAVISAEATRRGGASYPDHHEWAFGDLDGDGRPDFVVLYTIEVGNNYSTYLLALLENGKHHRIVGPVWAGGRGKRFVWFDSMARDRIHLRTKTFDPKNDAMCCPSLEGQATFLLQDEQLREERPAKHASPGD